MPSVQAEARETLGLAARLAKVRLRTTNQADLYEADKLPADYAATPLNPFVVELPEKLGFGWLEDWNAGSQGGNAIE